MADNDKFPIWKDSYEKIGVSSHELYMRQNGLCWLIPGVDEKGTTLHCTDGKDKALTSRMLNPTIECMNCICNFTEAIITDVIKENTIGNNT